MVSCGCVRCGLLVLILLGEAATAAYACSCAESPVCASYWVTPLVFVGRVTGIDLATDGARVDGELALPLMWSKYAVRLEVAETYRGEASKEIVVETPSISAACGIDFHVGEDYLVFAGRNERGAWTASSCSRTHQILNGVKDEDLKWIRGLATAPPGGRVFGQVLQIRPSGGAGSQTFLSGVTLTLTGAVSRKVVSNSNGQFSVEGLPPGTYSVSAVTPTGYTAFDSRTVEVLDRGCVELLFAARPSGQF